MRPDTIFAINVVSQFMCSPNEAHIKVVFEILKNLKGTHGIGLLFSKKDQVFFFLVFYFWIIEEPSMAKPLGLSMGTQTLGC